MIRRFGGRAIMLACAVAYAPGCLSPYATLGGGGGGDSTGGGFGGGTGGGTSAQGGGGGTPAPDAGLPEKNACATLTARRCDYYARCGLIDSTDSARRDCLAFLQATWCGPSRWPSRVDVGTLTYSPTLGQDCADAFSTLGCESYDDVPAPCAAMTQPNAAPGHACYDGYDECSMTGYVCRGASCPRTCQAAGLLNDVCELSSDCIPTLFCKPTVQPTGGGTCQNPGGVMTLCSVTEPCGPGLKCVVSHCVVPAIEGESCPTGICDDDSWCSPSAADGGLCIARGGAMTPCTDDAHCQMGLICQMMQCVAVAVTVPGDECSSRQTCPSGTACVGATSTQLGRCLTPLGENESCMTSEDCAPQLSCHSTDGGLSSSCGQREVNGESCTLDRDCELYSRCLHGLCTRLPYTGQDCTTVGDCLFGPCVATVDAGSVCTDRFGPGVTCSHDDDCASLRCLAGSCLPTCAP